MSVVLDSAAAVEWSMQTPRGLPVARRMLALDTDLHAPHIIDVEVVSALRRLVLRREATSGEST